MITIYHNPRCSKSREGLSVLEASGKQFNIVAYLKDVPTEKELTEIIKKLNMAPIDLIRKNEAIWKSDFKGKELSNKDIIKAMVNNPKLIERPIVINGNQAIIGRPPELIKTII